MDDKELDKQCSLIIKDCNDIKEIIWKEKENKERNGLKVLGLLCIIRMVEGVVEKIGGIKAELWRRDK